jgi:hypothetical protein
MTTQSLRRLCTLSAAFVLSLGLTLGAVAQTAALGGIAGVVRDSSGAIVPGATVKVTNTGTGASRTLTTNSEGFYQAQFLQPGTYEVVLGGGSFGKVDRKNIPVTVGASVSVDVTLPVASVTTDITVSTEPPVLDTEKVEQSQVIDQAVVSNVPVNSRRFESFVLLTPNVVPDGTSGLISYRGINGTYNQNIVDGGNNNQAFFSEARGRAIGSPFVFPVDAVREFESSATGYSAELGGAAGGIINAITKSGTNQFHGDLFEFYRTPGWNALDPINKYQGRLTNNPTLLTQPVKVQNEYGISIGGPIIKDKLFFHFTYDGYRKINPIVYITNYNSTTTNVANLVHLCDGGTTNLQDGTTIYPTSIPNVSLAGCQAGVAAIQAQFGAFSRNAKQDVYFPRLDYQLNSKTHLSAEFLFEDFHQPNQYTAGPTVTGGGVSQNGTANYHERILIASAETALSSRSANVVHFQWARDLETVGTNSGGPSFSLTNLASLGETNALPRPKFPDEHKWQGTDIYSIALGHHSIKAGFDLIANHEQIANLYKGNGGFGYTATSVETNFTNFLQDELGVNPTAVTGGAPGSGAVRHYNSFTQSVDQITGVGADDFWNQNVDGFVEDSWKATPTFLLQVGLRYDVQLVPGPNLPNTTNALAFQDTSQINPDLKMFQPRVGFNWNIQPGTVIRGGYGIFYGLIGNSAFYDIRRENGVYQKQYTAPAPTTAPTVYAACTPASPCVGNANVSYYNNAAYAATNPVGGVPIYTPPGPTPTNPVTGVAIAIPSSIILPASAIGIYGLDPSFKNPQSHSVDLTVEQQLPLRSTLTIGYVGNRALRLPVYVDTNIDPTSVTTAHTYQYTNKNTGAVTNFNEPIYTNKLYASSGEIFTGFSDVNSWYHSLVVTVKKPMSHGVELLANYTWARAMDGGQTYGSNATFGGTDAPLIPFALGHRQGRGAEYARSDLDVRGRFVGTLVAKSQFGLPNRYVSEVVNGWLLGTTVTAQSGEPISGIVSGTITAISGGQLGTPGISLNDGDGGVTGAVETSGPGARVPDYIAHRNAFTGPGVHNIDSRLSRSFPIFHDRYSFEVAAEAFNILNHRNILSVNTSLVAYTAPGATSPVGTVCPTTGANPGTVGCLGPLAASAAQFGSPLSTSGVIYGPRQLQLVAKFTF